MALLPSPRRVPLLLLLLGAAACAQPTRDQAWVADQITERTGVGGEAPLRAGALGDRPLTEDAAAAFALASSPTFAADLPRLGVARADLAEATRLTNPKVSLLAPIGTIVAAASLVGPIMELFQLPRRTAAASRMLESVAASLVQSGLDLVRDVRVAHAEAILAVRRVQVAEATAEQAGDLAAIAEARAEGGDIGPADALLVRSEAEVARRDHRVAHARLLTLLGADAQRVLPLVSRRPLPDTAPPLAALLELARAGRPDVRAAELALASAAARAGWERSRVVNLMGQVDVQWNRSQVGARVGGVLELPIFNQNQGGIGRAEAEIERASHQVEATRQQVTLEVIRARATLLQSLESRTRYHREVLPPLAVALDAARLRYELGEDSYLVVLDALGRQTAAELRVAELDADVRRARAELERAIGHRLGVTPREEVE